MIILKNGNKTARDFGFSSAIRTLEKGLKDIETPDVIIANDFLNGREGIKLKKKTGKLLIASIHLSHPEKEEEQALMKECDGVIVYSKAMKDFIKKIYPNLSVPIEVVQLGIDTDLWKCNETPREDFLLFVGRTKDQNKNFLEIMWKAIKEKIPLKVAGDLDYAEIPGVNVKYLSQKELMKWYQKAKLHILPSTFEPFGLVTLEAMACGCPVAVSTKAGVAELLNEKVAILFDPTKEFSLSEFMQKAGAFDSKEISDFARQFNHVCYAKSFVRAVERIIITQEIKRGDYNYFPVKDKAVLDIGAYLGLTAVHFSERGAKKVYAVEPFGNLSFIQKNIVFIKAGIGKKDDAVFIDPNYANCARSRLCEHIQEDGEPLKVMGINTLINSINENGIVLKMDCEGAEDSLFSANKKTLKKIDCMMIETHENICKGIGLELSMFLTQNGFKVRLEAHGKDVGMIYAENKLRRMTKWNSTKLIYAEKGRDDVIEQSIEQSKVDITKQFSPEIEYLENQINTL
uniref:Putative glycosyltransferase n=3 Tax=viral metagenome TaxID=1070528 RepID=A0A6M3X978_9ZZZZ